MKLKTRTAAAITGALAATAVAAVAAVASPTGPMPGSAGGRWPAHMEQMESGTYDEMLDMMNDDRVTMGEMHRWMQEQAGIGLDEMHADMARSGVNHGQMHAQMHGGS